MAGAELLTKAAAREFAAALPGLDPPLAELRATLAPEALPPLLEAVRASTHLTALALTFAAGSCRGLQLPAAAFAAKLPAGLARLSLASGAQDQAWVECAFGRLTALSSLSLEGGIVAEPDSLEDSAAAFPPSLRALALRPPWLAPGPAVGAATQLRELRLRFVGPEVDVYTVDADVTVSDALFSLFHSPNAERWRQGVEGRGGQLIL